MAAIALMILLWAIMLAMAWRLLADLLIWLVAALVYAAWGALDSAWRRWQSQYRRPKR